MSSFFKKFVVSVTLVALLSVTVISPNMAQAAIPVHDWPKTIIDGIWNGLKLAQAALTNVSLGLPGTGAATRAALRAGSKTCSSFKRAAEIASTADTFSDASVIAGSAGELASLTTKITALQIVRTCMEIVLEGGEAAGAVAALTGLQALQVLDNWAQIMNDTILSLDKRIDDLQARKTAAVKEMWKAVGVRILLTAQKQLTAQLVRAVVDRYKVSNYLDYADAVTSQIYTADYVNKNFPDSSDQLILRSIITNPDLGTNVHPAVQQKAREYTCGTPDGIDISDPGYFASLAQCGASKSDPYYVQSAFQAAADGARASARRTAEAEVAGGSGFIPVRNCANLTSQQMGFDLNAQRLRMNVQRDGQVLKELLDRQTANPSSVNAADITRAQAQLQQSAKQLHDLPKSDKAFTQPCNAITNPARAVSDWTNSYLAAQMHASASVKSDNVPFFANFAVAAADSFLNKILTNGGAINALFEHGYRSGNVTLTNITQTPEQKQATFLGDANTTAIQAGIIFTANKVGDSGQYTLAWDGRGVPGADSVRILGSGLPTTSVVTAATSTASGTPAAVPPTQLVNGSVVVSPPSPDTVYRIFVLDVNRVIIGIMTINLSSKVVPNTVQLTDLNNIQNALSLGQQYSDEAAAPVPPDTPEPPLDGTIIILPPGSVIQTPGITGTGTPLSLGFGSSGKVAGAYTGAPAVPQFRGSPGPFDPRGSK